MPPVLLDATPTLENLQTELLDFLQSKVSMCRQKQRDIHKVQHGGEKGRVQAGLEDALVLLPRLRYVTIIAIFFRCREKKIKIRARARVISLTMCA